MLKRVFSLYLKVVLLLAGLCLVGCRSHGENPPAAGQPPQPVSYPRSAEGYAWPQEAEHYEPLVQRFPPPEDFTRVEVAERSWGQWLRHLPLRPPEAPVRSHTGVVLLTSLMPVLGAVVDLDERKNQECADLIMRLRAEYLRWAGRESEIVFPVSGGKLSWPEWKRGMRPRLVEGKLRFSLTAELNSSRESFDRFLASVFAWCGTYSLAAEGKRVPLAEIQVGDFFAHPGSPGHAVLVADLARDQAGNLKALILQGFMPAQSAHLLRPNAAQAWFDLDPDGSLDLPVWGSFEGSELRRFSRGPD